MREIQQFRDPNLSLWQSAVDEVVAKHPAESATRSLDEAGLPVETGRPDQDNELISQSNAVLSVLDPSAPPAVAAERGIAEVAQFCATAALRLAQARVKAIFTGDQSEVDKFEQELGAKFGDCDPRWPQVVEKYVAFKVQGIAIPYRTHTAQNPFVLDTMPENATVALIGDWGTGEKTARQVLESLAAKKPDVVIHLGDIYYSGTQHEADSYFYDIWQQVLGLPRIEPGARLTAPSKPLTFTLSGNHDMYSGGVPYYSVIDRLGQPASYFCLRNSAWQFIVLDTGFFAANPLGRDATRLHDTEAQWLKDRIADAGGRKTVLLSHHQLFTAFKNERAGSGAVNDDLMQQVKDVLPAVTAWFWGHEHNLVIFKRFQGLLARCVGHGAFPVGIDQPMERDPDVPIVDVKLTPDSVGGLFSHGYVLMRLSGATADVSYLQFDGNKDTQLFHENL
jgi:hypothetical protein